MQWDYIGDGRLGDFLLLLFLFTCLLNFDRIDLEHLMQKLDQASSLTSQIGLKLVCRKFKGSTKHPCKRLGTFKCGGCGYCQYLDVATHKTLPNKVTFTPKHFANCKTHGVVYLLQCECTCFYVGKTKTEFWHRAYRHIVSMQSCNPDLPLGRHVTHFHSGIFPHIKFLILDRVHPGMRGGDWNKIPLQREQQWIFRLNATYFPGLNEKIPFKSFLEGFVSGGPKLY